MRCTTVICNCRLTFFWKFCQDKKFFAIDSFNIVTEKKFISSTVKRTNKNIKFSKRVLNSALESEITPFLDKNQLHLLTPLSISTKHFKIFYKFVVNYNVAKSIVDKILPHIRIGKDIVVEANPGLGLMTLNLINSDVPKIVLLDKSELINISVKQLMEQYQERLSLVRVNLFKFPGLQITDLIEDSVKQKSHSKVLGVISSNTFLINLMYTYILNELWNVMHYLEFYIVVSSTVWNTIITCTTNESRYFYHALFNFMFQYEHLAQYPSDAFFPVASNDKHKLTLVKITANSKLIERIIKDDLNHYVFFLEVLSRSKQTFIIPTLEKYVPNCGPYLIGKGVSMSNTIRDFSPSDKVILFNIFKECDGYDSFKAVNFIFSESAQIEMQETP